MPTDQPNPTEQNQQHQRYEKMTLLVSQVIQRHGQDYFHKQMLDFNNRISAVGEANQRLSDWEKSQIDEGYDQLAQEIMEATQAYYTFVGSLPEDMRKLLLQLTDVAGGSDGTLDDLSELIGTQLPQANPLLSIQSIRPKSYIMQVDAITNQLATLSEHNQLKVGTHRNQPVTTTVTLDMPDHMKIEGGAVLTTYDKSIINGVTSLIESGNTVFSVPMLYHAMTGKQNPTVDEQLSEELSGKLEKMRRMILTIDLTEESEAHYIKGENGETLKIEDVSLEGYLLPLNKISGVINGKKSELFQVLQHPPLYTYSKLRRQLASVPISILNAPVNNNSTTIPLKTYLLQRIEMMKNKNNNILSNVILYDSIYSELGSSDAGKTRKMRIRGYTTTILDYFIQQGYIKNFDAFKKGRSVAGISIEV